MKYAITQANISKFFKNLMSRDKNLAARHLNNANQTDIMNFEELELSNTKKLSQKQQFDIFQNKQSDE